MRRGAVGLLFEYPAIRLPVLGSVIGRIPLGVATVALLLGVQKVTGSTAAAGLVTASATAGVAAGAVVQGRMLDRLPRKMVLAGFAAVQVVALCALAAAMSARLPVGVLVGLSLLFGLSVPSLTAATKWMMRSVVAADQVASAFTLDTCVLQFLFVLGPAIAGLVTSFFGPAPALAGCALCILLGTAIFLRTCDASLLVRNSTASSSTAARASAPQMTWIVIFLIAMTLVALSSGFLSLAITSLATVRHASLEPVGIAFSTMSAGSLVGGLVYSTVKWRAPVAIQYVMLAVGNAALLGLLTALPRFPLLYVETALAGLFLSPLSSLASQTLDRLAPQSAWMQTQAWGTVASTGGQTAGLASGGILASAAGPGPGFACASGAVVLAAVIALPTLLHAAAITASRRTREPDLVHTQKGLT